GAGWASRRGKEKCSVREGPGAFDRFQSKTASTGMRQPGTAGSAPATSPPRWEPGVVPAQPRTPWERAPPLLRKRRNATSVTQNRSWFHVISDFHIDGWGICSLHDYDTFVALNWPARRPSHTLYQFKCTLVY